MAGRREVVLGGLLMICWEMVAIRAFAENELNSHMHGHIHGPGCMLTPEQAASFFNDAPDTRMYITGSEPMIPKSGNNQFDFALAQTLAKISSLFDVLPGFAYYDDSDGLNAYATPAVRLDRSDGTVLFGQHLLGRLMNGPESPDASVAAVCAHEFGHIVQQKKGLMPNLLAGQKSVKRAELQADFLSGYFAGIRKLERPTFPAAVFAMTQYNFGDNMVNNPSHHGTPEERSGAIVAGFKVAFTGRQSFSDALISATNYVMRM